MLLLKKISTKKILILILLLTAFLRLYRLDFPKNYVFDEVYHAFTAKEYLQNHKVAWEWWNAPPPGVAYEWTHPPLAKEIMAASMFLLKTQDVWAYRLPGVILGVLSVYLVYLLGLKLLKNKTASLFASFLFSLDGLNFVQSRTGMNDIYFVTFMLASLLLMLNKRFVISSIFLGLAISSKWAAVYTYLIFIPLLLYMKEYKKIFFFFVIPPIVYFITYIPFFLSGHTFDQFIQLQKQMWWYHTNLKASHNYSSRWWSWPLNLYPVWYFVEYQKENMANIFASGNPALFWLGSGALILTAWEAFKKRAVNLVIILLGFLAFWLPWSASPRIMFLYHFSPSVAFLTLALGYQLGQLTDDKKGGQLALTLILLTILGFAFIFPFITGIFLPKNYINLFFMSNLTKNPFQ
ncbi:phospholipid carrier-dependent glycosyltransferase [Candidatus Daviesbacteria bacterium]|nr:phospholipid carrier-dependent glycosyltransferase [Candidatus Daviesbacteria bacterium]